MELLPNIKSIKLHCLTNSGVFEKLIAIENLIPVTHDDYRLKSAHSLLGYPQFIDNEMIFYNTHQTEFYLFDSDCVWVKENMEHEALAVENLMNEKLWFDYIRSPC